MEENLLFDTDRKISGKLLAYTYSVEGGYVSVVESIGATFQAPTKEQALKGIIKRVEEAIPMIQSLNLKDRLELLKDWEQDKPMQFTYSDVNSIASLRAANVLYYEVDEILV